AIAFDVIFSEVSDPAKDAIFAEALKGSKNVYLAEVFEESSKSNAKLLTSLPEFTRNAKGGGHINLRPDIDGVMRRIPLLYRGSMLPQLSFAIALDHYQTTPERLLIKNNRIMIPAGTGETIEVPVDQDKNMMINW